MNSEKKRWLEEEHNRDNTRFSCRQKSLNNCLRYEVKEWRVHALLANILYVVKKKQSSAK